MFTNSAVFVNISWKNLHKLHIEMFGFTLTTLTTLLMLAIVVNSQSNDTGQADQQQPSVWCPEHLKPAVDEYDTYKHCEPDICFDRTVNQQYYSDRVCLDDLTEEVLHGQMTNESCQWVTLRQNQHFQLNLIDGSIYENNTNLTYNWGDYVYVEHLQEAIICRQQLLPGDDTHHITLWCHSHTIELSEPPQIQDNGDFHLPKLNLIINHGFYHVHNDSLIDICLEMDLEFMRCEVHGLPDQNHEPFHLQDDLSYLVQWQNGHKVYPVGHYYLSADHTTLLVCLDDIEPPILFGGWIFDDGYFYPLHITSAVFLFITLLVHLFYPELNYHTKPLVCHTASMMVMDICRVVSSVNLKVESVVGMFSLFGFHYVSAMSTHLWLTVLAYDVWKVLKNVHGSLGESATEMSKKLWFVVKCLFAWGIPLVFCVLVIGFSHDSDVDQLTARKTSFFYDYKSILKYFYGPIAFIRVVNMAFIGLTVWNIRRARHNRRTSQKLFYLCVKLFVVMAICFVADVISCSVKGDAVGRSFYWSDVISSLQGVAISVVYVCKPSTWWLMKRKFGFVDDASAETTVTTTSPLASSDVEMK